MTNWTEDESVLALEAYFDLKNIGLEKISPFHPRIIQLSYTLKSLPIYPETTRSDPSFRPPDGVRARVAAFARLEKGNSDGIGSIHQQVWQQYCNNLDALKSKVKSIESQTLINHGVIEDNLDDEGFIEGRVIEKLHKSRERNRKVVKKKKKEVIETLGHLACEVCTFDFYQFYGDIGRDFAECHHIHPLSEIASTTVKTQTKDLAIVCANCHRMLHSKRPWMAIGELRKLIQSKC